MQDFLDRIETLEDAAIKSRYTREQTLTALRKIYFSAYSGKLNYAGSAIPGGTWDLLIPSPNTEAPIFWSSLSAERQFLRINKIVSPGGFPVDMARVFCGLDARNHPTVVSLAHGIKFSSNLEALTFIGDLGCVVVEYIQNSHRDIQDLARNKHPQELSDFYENNFLNEANIAGSADAYAINFLPGDSIYAALTRYYLKGAYAGRFNEFRQAIKIELSDTPNYLAREVLKAALAYAAAKPKYKQEVIQVTSHVSFTSKSLLIDGDEAQSTTAKAYYNISLGLVELFLKRIKSRTY